jgi:hypothetical protein
MVRTGNARRRVAGAGLPAGEVAPDGAPATVAGAATTSRLDPAHLAAFERGGSGAYAASRPTVNITSGVVHRQRQPQLPRRPLRAAPGAVVPNELRGCREVASGHRDPRQSPRHTPRAVDRAPAARSDLRSPQVGPRFAPQAQEAALTTRSPL